MPIVFDTNIILLIASILIIALLTWVIRLEMRLNRFLRGKDAKSLEDAIVSTDKEVENLKSFNKELQNYLTRVESRLKRGVQGIETVRFNAFKGTGEGGNQSFATAFLTEKGDGVIISTLYTRERTSVFSKPVGNFESELELTEEEQKVLDHAKESLK